MPAEVMFWLVAPIPERTIGSKKDVTEFVLRGFNQLCCVRAFILL